MIFDSTSNRLQFPCLLRSDWLFKNGRAGSERATTKLVFSILLMKIALLFVIWRWKWMISMKFYNISSHLPLLSSKFPFKSNLNDSAPSANFLGLWLVPCRSSPKELKMKLCQIIWTFKDFRSKFYEKNLRLILDYSYFIA